MAETTILATEAESLEDNAPVIMRYPLVEAGYKAMVSFTVVTPKGIAAGPDDAVANENSNNGEHVEKAPKAAEKIGETVKLYLPTGLSYNDGVTYDNVNIGAIGAAIEGAITSGKGVGGAVEAMGASMFGGLEDLSTQGVSSQAGRLAASKMAENFLGDELAGAVQGALRTKMNPQTRVLFGSVPLRTFDFTFNFQPTSKEEYRQCIDIIKLFRTELYPMGIGKMGDTDNFLGYDYPNMFRIAFKYGSKKLEDAPQIKDCYLQSANTNWNPNSMIFYKDGKFSEFTLSLSFSEAKTLVRQDIEKGF